MSDDRLRELYARTVPASSQHASPEDILALVQKTGDEDHRLHVLDHVMSCAACQRDFDLLRTIDSAAANEGAMSESATADSSVTPLRRKAKHAFWQSGYTRLLAAAVILTVIGVGVDSVRERPASGDLAEITRGGATGNVISLASPQAGSQSSSPVVLVWHPAPGAAQYSVEVLDSNSNVVTGGSTTDTTYTIPAAALQRAGDYSWWVRARTTRGDASSALRRLRISSR